MPRPAGLEALLKCGEAFSAPETAPKGRYLGMEATWGGHDPERIEALGLPFVAVDAGTESAMFAELKSAYERKAPIMLWVYSPHWVPSVFEGEWVQFPEYTAACYTDPKWASIPTRPSTAASRMATSSNTPPPRPRRSGPAPMPC